MEFIKKWSFGSAKHLAEVMKENHQKRYCYYYGFQIIYGELVKSILLLGIAWVLGIFSSVLLILITFAALRMVAGGFHMDTYGRCLFVSTVMFLGAGLLAQYTNRYWNIYSIFLFIFVTFLIGLSMVVKYAPRDTPNKPITDVEEMRRFKRLSIYYLVIWLVITLILVIYGLNIAALSLCFAVLLEVFTITPTGCKFFEYVRSGIAKKERHGGNCVFRE